MYKAVLYVLFFLVLVAMVLSLMGELYFTPEQLLISLMVLCTAGVGTHYVWKELTGAPANLESSLISALILFFLFDPADSMNGAVALALIAVLTITTKYLCAWHKLHFFNPVALGALLASLFSLSYATWWIGGALFLIPVLIGGALITQKIRRFPLVITTIVTAY